MGSGSPGMSTHNNRMILFVGTSFFGRNRDPFYASFGWMKCAQNTHAKLLFMKKEIPGIK